MPFARCEVVHLYLAKRDVKHQEDIDRQQRHKLWSYVVAKGSKHSNMGENQIDNASEDDGAQQCPLFDEFNDAHR